ncbi:MAG TPA: YpdA family putative bacillithiol disulfide reductase [bacterium]
MTDHHELFDVIIIGAGPAGLACAIEAKKQNLNYVVIEKGCLVNSIFHFPTDLTFFSTADLLEIGDVPFVLSAAKPKRRDVLNYYRRVAEYWGLRISLYESVLSVSGERGDLQVETNREGKYRTRNVVLATGQFDSPRLMGIPGENLAKVNHYYVEAHAYFKKNVVVIGGKNSAVEAALDLYHHGAEVTLIHRGETFGKSVKYWILPDIENRIKERKIQAHFQTEALQIKEDSMVVKSAAGEVWEIENDFVFAMTGYRPDIDFLRKMGVQFTNGDTPVHNPKTLETHVPGVYIAGVITAGSDGSKVFIENSRHHGAQIMGHILNGK